VNSLDIADCINEICPWSGKPVQADSLTEYNDRIVGFCNPGCRDKFAQAVRHFENANLAPAERRHAVRTDREPSPSTAME